jgi:hypothetical protein
MPGAGVVHHINRYSARHQQDDLPGRSEAIRE